MGNERKNMFGRRAIVTREKEITAENVVEELAKALNVHELNRSEIDYLWKYYKGDQPILSREKLIRPEICNRIVENRANEIVTFKTGYQCGKPIKYVATHAEGDSTAMVALLNAIMQLAGKEANDQELFEWWFATGIAYRMALPVRASERGLDDAPIKLYCLDPRNAFVVRSTDIDEKVVMGVKYSTDVSTNVTTYSVYTRNKLFTIVDGVLKSQEDHFYGQVPIYEYTSSTRLGSFETVLPLLDAINTLQSNRLDGVEQNIQSFLKFVNCAVDKAQMEQLKELGAIMIKAIDGQHADVGTVKTDIDQAQTQTLKNDLEFAVARIAGMPTTGSGNTSDSSNNGAVLLKNGWENAETIACKVENCFKRAETEMLKLVLHLLRTLGIADIRLANLDIKFTRRNYENIQSKSQVLVSMLNSDRCHPQLAFECCGMFSDPESAYLMSKEWWEAEEKKNLDDLNELAGVEHEDE